MDGEVIQRKEGTPGQENPGSDREIILKIKDRKGGANRQGKADTGFCEELLGLTSRGGNRRRAVEAGRQGRRPGGRSLRAWAIWGGRSGYKEREKRRLQVKYGRR